MITERAHLGELTIDQGDGAPLPSLEENAITNLTEYSQFKYGEGAAAQKYGRMLGEMTIAKHGDVLLDGEVYVASSAFRIAPPASQGLVEPFVESARASAAQSGARALLTTFAIGKSRLATDGYADMSFEERRATLQSDLILPADMDFAGSTVVMLDDIRVTGLREEALEGLFAEHGAERTVFGYVLNVENGQQFPKIEGVLNRTAVKNLDDIINVANLPGYIPNVRACKFIAAQGPEAIERFCDSVPPEVAETVCYYIDSEDLQHIVKIVP